jgi:glyoxalase family protein
MPDAVPGLHHVTAIAGDARANLAFYTDALGLRTVKRTVNFDDVGTYHLYYGDATGSPGSVLTFFPFETAPPGQVGRGQATATAFAVPPGSLEYWSDRLQTVGADPEPPAERFGETVVAFTDPDGQPLELVARDATGDAWDGGPVPEEHAVRGLHGVTLHSLDADATGSVLETLGYERKATDGDRTRFGAPGDRATAVDLLDRPEGPRGRQGTGTVHHVAFRAADEAEQRAWRDRLQEAGLYVTPVKDRHYFQSIYFREPGGVLFEIATEGPGFTRDESVADLGSSLQLPPWLEDDREDIAANLPSLAEVTNPTDDREGTP